MKTIKDYNTPETILALTSYPDPKGQETGQKSFNAVGWHSAKTLGHLAEKNKIIVLAEKNGSQEIFSPRSNMRVVRMWEKGNIFSFITLYRYIMSLTQVRRIFVQFEFNVFGGTIQNIILLLMLCLLRLSGRQITFELHQVITDVGMLKKHIRLGSRPVELFFNLGLKFFYGALGLIATNIVVFEQALKNKLVRFVDPEKVIVLSIAVDKKKPQSRQAARRQLKIKDREFVILVFGFINGYKGIDWIIKAMQGLEKDNIRLIIAGGENPYLADTPHYRAFYQKVRRLLSRNKQIIHTGFVPDHEISRYFSACDVVCLPYEVFMSASGPFSLALSYGKPVMLSERLLPYSQSSDFAVAQRLSGLTLPDIFFDLKKKDFQRFVRSLKMDMKNIQKMTYFSETLASLRSSEYVIDDLRGVITRPGTSQPKPALMPETAL